MQNITSSFVSKGLLAIVLTV